MAAASKGPFGQGRDRRCAGVAALALALVLAQGVPAGKAATPEPVGLTYEVYARGFPILTLDLRIAETGSAYKVEGLFRTVGVIDWLADFVLRSESRGAVVAGALRPRVHESAAHSRKGDRRAHLDYGGDGTVATVLSPAAAEPGHALPTPQQTVGTLDPLSAVLAIHHEVVRSGSCGMRMPVFDGRRRYDLVLADEGMGRLASSASAGEVRRCSVDLVKIAGFSSDLGVPPHTDHGQVWILPAQGGAPAVPARIEFGSDWGPIVVQMTRIGFAP